MLRSAARPFSIAAVVGGPVAAYFAYTAYNTPETFLLAHKVKGADGKPEMTTRTLPLLPLKLLEARIREGASSQIHTSPNGLSWKYTTAALASNDPIEDANASQIIRRDNSDASAPGDYLFFAVMDGHSGYQTSQLLSRILIKAVALELNSIAKPTSATKPGILENVKSLVWSSPSQTALDADPTRVSSAIQDAFTKLDAELLNAPLRVLANNLDEEARKNKNIPDLSKHPLALTTMLPALSGSCALMAVFDTAHRDLYVACTGDSRAVAGVWEPTDDGKGHWRIEVLSDDQTGRNPSELARVRSEHPQSETNDVIREGRILGGLEPSRAFGDARYKWPRAVQETLNQAFMIGNDKNMRPPPSLFKTPPYVTASPVITHRKLSFAPSANSTEKSKRFLVLATDGLWDQLSNEEVVSLVGGYYLGLKGTLRKSELPLKVPTSSGSAGVEGKVKGRNHDEGSWAFEDANVSAHLIRNAFGGGNVGSLRRLLSIPAPYSRRYRDDVTVTVVCWEEGNEESATVVTDKLKAKL